MKEDREDAVKKQNSEDLNFEGFKHWRILFRQGIVMR